MVKGKPNLVCLTINQLGDSSGIISDIYCCGQVGESKMCWKLKDECQIARHQAKRELLVPEKLSGLNQYVFISASASDEHVYAEPFVPVELVAPLLPKLEGEQRAGYYPLRRFSAALRRRKPSQLPARQSQPAPA